MGNITQFAKIHAIVNEKGELIDSSGNITGQILKENEIGICYNNNSLLTRKDNEIVILSSKYDNSVTYKIKLNNSTTNITTDYIGINKKYIINYITVKAARSSSYKFFISINKEITKDTINDEDILYIETTEKYSGEETKTKTNYFVLNKEYEGVLTLYAREYKPSDDEFYTLSDENMKSDIIDVYINYTPIND